LKFDEGLHQKEGYRTNQRRLRKKDRKEKGRVGLQGPEQTESMKQLGRFGKKRQPSYNGGSLCSMKKGLLGFLVHF
jgi:hypothetical protein